MDDAAGVIRGDGNVPTALGELLPLAAPSGTPIDAAWVDERSVATLSQDTGAASVTEFEVGGPSASLGQIPDGVSMVGGSNGADGLRVLRTTGDAYRPAGSGGWVDTGIAATFLGTKQ